MIIDNICRALHPQPQLRFIIHTNDPQSKLKEIITRFEENYFKRSFASKRYIDGFVANGKIFANGPEGRGSKWRFAIEISSQNNISIIPERQLLLYSPLAIPIATTMALGIKPAAIFYPIAIAALYFGKYVYIANSCKFIQQLLEIIGHSEIDCIISNRKNTKFSEKLTNFKYKNIQFSDLIKL